MTDPYYDITGDGPVLLIVPGGAGHPMGLGPVTDALSAHFTVVTYDPLGLAHGRLGEPVEDQRVQDWSDGARRVLDEVLAEGESAYVFGTSSRRHRRPRPARPARGPAAACRRARAAVRGSAAGRGTASGRVP